MFQKLFLSFFSVKQDKGVFALACYVRLVDYSCNPPPAPSRKREGVEFLKARYPGWRLVRITSITRGYFRPPFQGFQSAARCAEVECDMTTIQSPNTKPANRESRGMNGKGMKKARGGCKYDKIPVNWPLQEGVTQARFRVKFLLNIELRKLVRKPGGRN